MIKDGYFIINIKDFADYKLVDDTIKLAEDNLFILVDKEPIQLLARPSDDVATVKEWAYVFKKK